MSRFKLIFLGIFTQAVLLAAYLAGCVQAQQLSYHGSMQYATGSYFFQQNTESFSISNGLNLQTKYFSISFSVPYIYQNSPWLSYGAEGAIPTGGPQHNALMDSTGHRPGSGKGGSGSGSGSGSGQGGGSMRAQSVTSGTEVISIPDTSSFNRYSFGDPSLFAHIRLYSSESGTTLLQLNSSVKFPLTNPNSGFGTGEWDFSLGLSASQRLQQFFLFADVTKWWFGDMPGLELKDPIAYSIGLGYSMAGGKWMVNASYSGYTDIIQGYEPPRSINTGIGYLASSKVSLSALVSFGLSESSADVSVGLGWIIGL